MKLKEYRKKNGLKQEQLAKKLGVVFSTVCRYEMGTRFPDRDMLKKIDRVTKGAVKASDFLEDK